MSNYTPCRGKSRYSAKQHKHTFTSFQLGLEIMVPNYTLCVEVHHDTASNSRGTSPHRASRVNIMVSNYTL